MTTIEQRQGHRFEREDGDRESEVFRRKKGRENGVIL